MPAKQTMRWMAPALPVFAAKAAPSGIFVDLGEFVQGLGFLAHKDKTPTCMRR